MAAQEALNEAAWNPPEQEQEQIQENGWCAWAVIPPPYSGFSFKTFFQYNRPSLMDGVDPEHNSHDNLSDVWASDEEIEQVEALANGFVLGNPLVHSTFFRAGGGSVNLLFALDHDFLC